MNSSLRGKIHPVSNFDEGVFLPGQETEKIISHDWAGDGTKFQIKVVHLAQTPSEPVAKMRNWKLLWKLIFVAFFIFILRFYGNNLMIRNIFARVLYIQPLSILLFKLVKIILLVFKYIIRVVFCSLGAFERVLTTFQFSRDVWLIIEGFRHEGLILCPLAVR